MAERCAHTGRVLELPWVVSTYALTLTYLAYAWRKAKEFLSEEKSAWASALASAIFAAQMLNWPIPGGPSPTHSSGRG